MGGKERFESGLLSTTMDNGVGSTDNTDVGLLRAYGLPARMASSADSTQQVPACTVSPFVCTKPFRLRMLQ